MYNNYGDVNFFDYGVLVEADSNNENIFRIIKCQPDCDMENHYALQDVEIDVTDSWIDKHEVCAFNGLRDVSIDYTDEEKVLFAIGVVDYYGSNAGGFNQWMVKNEVIDYIEHHADVEYEFWKDNFTEDNRNVVACIYDNRGFKSRNIYDSLEDAMDYFKDVAEKDWSIEIEDM